MLDKLRDAIVDQSIPYPDRPVREAALNLKLCKIDDSDDVIESFFKSIDLNHDGRISWP